METDPTPKPEEATSTRSESALVQPRLVRVCPVCGSRPAYSLYLVSEWIACPNGCLKILVKGGASPEYLESQWNVTCNLALASEVANTPFNDYFDVDT